VKVMNMFNVWNEAETKKVYRWLVRIGVLGWVSFFVCFFMLLWVKTINYIAMPVLIGNIEVFLVINPYGVYINSVIVYHLFSDFALSVIAVQVFSLSLGTIILFYGYFSELLKDITGYEHYGEVRKAISVFIHGSGKNKIVFAWGGLATSIIFAIGLTAAVSLLVLELVSPLETALILISTVIFFLTHAFPTRRYIKRRILPKSGK